MLDIEKQQQHCLISKTSDSQECQAVIQKLAHNDSMAYYITLWSQSNVWNTSCRCPSYIITTAPSDDIKFHWGCKRVSSRHWKWWWLESPIHYCGRNWPHHGHPEITRWLNPWHCIFLGQMPCRQRDLLVKKYQSSKSKWTYYVVPTQTNVQQPKHKNRILHHSLDY